MDNTGSERGWLLLDPGIELRPCKSVITLRCPIYDALHKKALHNTL